MKNQNRYEELFDSFLDLTEFALVKYHNGFGLKDLQGGNLGNIETERFSDAGQIVDRMESYIEDYLVTPILENVPYYVGEALTWGEIAEMLLNSSGDSEGDVTMLDAIINHAYDIRLDNCTHEDDETDKEG